MDRLTQGCQSSDTALPVAANAWGRGAVGAMNLLSKLAGDRAAARLRRAAANAWGVWGAISWGVWGAISGPPIQ
jgi:hypothetical protein